MYNTNLIMLLVLLMITLRATHVACQEMSSTEVYLQKGMYPSQLAISPEGKQIIICGTDINSLLSFELDNDGLFDFSNGHEMPANNDKLTSIENCMFSSDGKSVIARSSGTYDLFIWSRDETFQTLGQINPASVVKVTLGDAVDFEVSNSKGMDISPDGKQVFTIGGRKLVYFDRVLDPTTNRWILQNKMAIKLVDDSICDVKVTPGKFRCKHVVVARIYSIDFYLITVYFLFLSLSFQITNRFLFLLQKQILVTAVKLCLGTVKM